MDRGRQRAAALVRLIGPSRFGSTAEEGVVLRRDDGQVCKVVRPGFVRAGDDGIGRRRNTLARRVADDTRPSCADPGDVRDTAR